MLPPSGSGQKILPPWNQYAAASDPAAFLQFPALSLSFVADVFACFLEGGNIWIPATTRTVRNFGTAGTHPIFCPENGDIPAITVFLTHTMSAFTNKLTAQPYLLRSLCERLAKNEEKIILMNSPGVMVAKRAPRALVLIISHIWATLIGYTSTYAFHGLDLSPNLNFTYTCIIN